MFFPNLLLYPHP